MDKEEFERLKAAEKAHLQELKRLKGMHREASRLAKIRRALGEMEAASGSAEYDEMLDRVQREAIDGEVRLDMALDANAEAGLPDVGSIQDDEAAREARAAALVRQMRELLGGGVADSPEDAEAEATDGGPDKTIGRRPKAEDAPSPQDDLPEKTIGRRPKG